MRPRSPRPRARPPGRAVEGRSGAERPGSRAFGMGARSIWECKKCILGSGLLSIVTSICVACSGGPAPLDSGPMSRSFLATLHYDGTGFVGWQRQPAGRSVQAEFERVLERLCGRRLVAHAAGRTDAGVHASGLAVSFSAPASWTTGSLRRALNALLPRDCWVESLHLMQPGFHARKSAISRRYRYDIGLDEASASPFRRPFEW